MRRWRLPVLGVVGIWLWCALTACFEQAERLNEASVPAADPPPVDAQDPRASAQGDGGFWLTAASRFERETAGGKIHTYPVRLERDQYFSVVVTQRGLDVAVDLSDPRGRSLLAVDGPNGPNGPESLAVVAVEEGVHRLTVCLPDDAGAGGYRIDVVALRSARVRDRDYATAMRLYAEAEVLRKEQDAASRRRALAGYRAVLERLSGLEAPLLRARALRRIGQVLDNLGEVAKALGFFERSLAIHEAVGSAWELTPLLNGLGDAWRRVGEPEKAREHFVRALEIAEALGKQSSVASTLNNLGVLHDSLGELQEALSFYDRALTEWQELGSRSRAGGTLHNMGVNSVSLGRVQEGLDFLRQSLEISRDTDDRHRQAVTLTAMGWAYSAEGDHESALAELDEAIALRRAVGDRQGEAVTLDLRGNAHRELGEWEAAIASYTQALALIRDSGNRLNEAHTLANLGHVYQARGESEKALKYLSRALGLSRRIGDLNGEASALVGMAEAQRHRGDLAAARARLEEALAIVESVRRRLQSTSLRSAYLATRFDDYGLYVDLLMELHATEPGRGYAELAFEASERIRARGLLEGLTAARAGVRRGAAPEILARERVLRAKINARENARVRLLSEGSAPAKAAVLETELRALLLDYEKLQGEILATSSRHASLVEPRLLGLRQIQELLDEDTLLLAYTLGEQRSFLWTVGRSSFDSFTLPPRHEIDELARRAHRLLPRSHEPGFRRQAALAAEALSKAILAPGADRLRGKRRLVTLIDGALQYVPLGALPVDPASRADGLNGRDFLLSRHEVVSLPSASVLGVLRREDTDRSDKLLAVVADPIFHLNDPRLSGGTAQAADTGGIDRSVPAVVADLERSVRDFGVDRFERLLYSGAEAEAILALAPAAETFLAVGFAASRATVTSGELSRYRIVHFATHGLMNARHPALSGIVLSLVDAAGRPQDGFLRVHEIPELDLAADLVVLSACRTALGKEVRGEGLMGLTRGFFHAGAARVVVSFWNVSDRATAELMARFYRGMLKDGSSASEALRAAQLSMLEEERWEAPYYWAGFALQGDWR